MPDMLAIYDFEVSPISFDFFSYLALADLDRRRMGADRLHLLIIPAHGDGFHPNVRYGLDQKRWRLRNLVVDGAGLLLSCAGVLQAGSREQARALIAAHRGPIHPIGYAIDAPHGYSNAGFMTIEANAGESLHVFRASEQARTYARQWLDERRGGRKAVSITLREATHSADRNSVLDGWAEFARHLHGRDFYPFVLRDIETALDAAPPILADIAECPAAVFNIDLRLALYELCFLNLFVHTGPVALCQLSLYPRFVSFPGISNEETLHKFYEDIGCGLGESAPYLNRLQRYSWRTPSFDVLREEFDSLEERVLEHEAAGCPVEDLDCDPIYRRDPIVIARHFFNARRWPELDMLVADCERRGTGSPDLRALKDDADREQAALAQDERDYNQALDLRTAGDFDAAIDVLSPLVERRPSEARLYVDLGLAYEGAGRIRDAETLYRTAIACRVATIAIVYRLGCIAQGLGDVDTARACFDMILGKADGGDGIVVEDVRARLASIRAMQP